MLECKVDWDEFLLSNMNDFGLEKLTVMAEFGENSCSRNPWQTLQKTVSGHTRMTLGHTRMRWPVGEGDGAGTHHTRACTRARE